jgi:hypothetical protein
MEPNKLYTNKRLSDFVDNYKTFVDEITNTENDPTTESYKYFQFQYSPDAINSTSIGRFGSSLFETYSAWSLMPKVNGNSMDAWKMNLGKRMIPFTKSHNDNIRTRISGEMKYTLKQFANITLITDIKQLNVDMFDVLAQIAYNDTPTSNLGNMTVDNSCRSGYAIFENQINSSPTTCIAPFTNLLSMASGKKNPSSDFSMTVLSDFITKQTSNNSSISSVSNSPNIVTVEWSGYFISEDGIYTFELKAGSKCKYFVWFGRKSICEFVSSNADLTDQPQNSYTFMVTNNAPIHIRIQCMFLYGETPEFDTIITQQQLSNMNTTSPSISIDALRSSTMIPFALYAAFVSPNQQSFLNNSFECFSNVAEVDTSDGETLEMNPTAISSFYKQFRQNLPDVLNLKYDYNSSNRLSYGTIPNINTQYTIRNTIDSLPFAFSIYRLEADLRMGNMYQINTEMNNSVLFPAHQLTKTVTDGSLTYANTFAEKIGYYPNNSSLLNQQSSSQIGHETALECKEKCVKDDTCSNYFTFTSNGASKCITTSVIPEFNRVIPTNAPIQIDPQSSSLFLRDYQLILPDAVNCGTSVRPSNVIPITNTSNYSKNFSFFNYSLGGEISKPSQIGVCGSPAYEQQRDNAKKILFDSTDYADDGKWKEGNQWKSVEGFAEKNTDAVLDTSDGIRTNLKNSEIYANKMNSVSERHSLLSSKLIPQYKNTRAEMEGDPKYDYNGKSLLYFRNKAIPQLRDKRISDNNEQYVTSQLMLSLGTLTAATLVVFAILLARD